MNIHVISSQEVYQGSISEEVVLTDSNQSNEPEFIWSDNGDSIHISMVSPPPHGSDLEKTRQDLAFQLSERLTIEADVQRRGQKLSPVIAANYQGNKWQGYMNVSPQQLNQYRGQMGMSTQIGRTQINPYLESSMMLLKHPSLPKVGMGYEVNGGLNLAHQFSPVIGVNAGVELPIQQQYLPASSQVSSGINLFNKRVSTGGYIGFQEGRAQTAGAQLSVKPLEGVTVSGKVGQQPKGMSASGNLNIRFHGPVLNMKKD